MPIPDKWKDADWNDPLVRKVFADWLEEQGDWRANEIRRIKFKRKGNYKSYSVYSGPFKILKNFLSEKNAFKAVLNLLYTKKADKFMNEL